MTEQKRAVIYARSATFPDHGAAFPITQQIHLCKEYAIREGYEVVDEFQEVGSGMLIGPVLKSVREAAKEGKFDTLLICTLDRLTRNQVKKCIVIDTLEEYGVNVIVVTEPELLSDIDGNRQEMIAFLLEEVAKIERERISIRSKAGKRAKKLAQEGL